MDDMIKLHNYLNKEKTKYNNNTSVLGVTV